jgi:hypothetical protein
MEYEKDPEFSIGQLVVGLFILAGAGTMIWGVFSEESEPAPAPVTQQEQVEKVAIQPVIEIATLYNQPMSELTEQFDTSLNSAGNLLYENDEFKLLVESRDGVTSDYVEVQLKSLGTCSKAGVVRNSDEALSLVGLKSHLKGSQTNSSAGIANGAIEYCDYPSNSFAVGTACMFDGGYYDVSLSPRTYCED